ncbi:hypothetical protein [Pseudosulfitobacter sp. SM2401]|uniref:hypothetical protein n=1 Tax=Pseudosulfitobacter sp. SM2401 TaxID=3350098 RepID=UPI0036F2D56D
MNADRLLELYEQISKAPDAIVRLRRFALNLAVSACLREALFHKAMEQTSVKAVEAA